MPRQRFQILDHQHPTNLNLVYTQRECRPRVSAAASWRCQRLLAKCHSLERLPSYWKTSVEKRKQVAMNISTNLSFEFHPRIFSPSRFTGNIIFHLSQWNELCLVRPWSFFASEREGERTTHQKQKNRRWATTISFASYNSGGSRSLLSFLIIYHTRACEKHCKYV